MNLFQAILILFVRLYQRTLSPVLSFIFGPHAGCRYTPTCSEYALDAIRSHGALAGSWLAVKRIGRCNPWGGCGHDPVPEKRKAQTLNIKHRTPNIERWNTAAHATRNTQHGATLNTSACAFSFGATAPKRSEGGQLPTFNHGTAAHGS